MMKKLLYSLLILTTNVVSAQEQHQQASNLADGQIDGHDYVSIGGLKWATMNVGATTVAGTDTIAMPSYIHSSENNSVNGKVYSCFGTYFKWGEITSTWSSAWRIPTQADYQALSVACAGEDDASRPVTTTSKIEKGGIYWLDASQEYEPSYTGVTGILFVEKSDPSKRLFFPATGVVEANILFEAGNKGFCWTSTLDPDDSDYAWNLDFCSYLVYPATIGSAFIFCYPVRLVSD